MDGDTRAKHKTQTSKTTDFALAVAGHNGDMEAADILWKRHRLRMIGMLGKYNRRLPKGRPKTSSNRHDVSTDCRQHGMWV